MPGSSSFWRVGSEGEIEMPDETPPAICSGPNQHLNADSIAGEVDMALAIVGPSWFARRPNAESFGAESGRYRQLPVSIPNGFFRHSRQPSYGAIRLWHCGSIRRAHTTKAGAVKRASE